MEWGVERVERKDGGRYLKGEGGKEGRGGWGDGEEWVGSRREGEGRAILQAEREI